MMMAESGIELRLTEIEGMRERDNALQFAITGEKEKGRKSFILRQCHLLFYSSKLTLFLNEVNDSG